MAKQETVTDFDHPTTQGIDSRDAGEAIESLLSDDLLLIEETEEPSEPPADDEDDAGSDDEAEEDEESDDRSDETDEEEESEDEESEDEEPEEDEDEETYVVVKIDGKETEVTLDEAIKGYQRTADYTRKTQKLAEERKAFEAEVEEVRVSRDAYAEKLAQAGEFLSMLLPEEPNWDKLREEKGDAEFNRQYAAFQQRKRKLDQLNAEKQRVLEEQAKDFQRKYGEVVREEADKLLDALPTWREPEVAKKERDALFDYALSNGFTQEEIENLVDHRAVLLLYKAMKLDEMNQKGKARLEKKRKKGRRVVRPGGKKAERAPSSKSSKRHKALRDQLAKGGRTKDAIAIFEDMIPDDEFDR